MMILKIFLSLFFTAIILTSFFLTRGIEIYALYFLTPYLLSWSIGRVLVRATLPASLHTYLLRLQQTFEQSGLLFIWAFMMKVMLLFFSSSFSLFADARIFSLLSSFLGAVHYGIIFLGGWFYSNALLKMIFFGRGNLS